MPKKILNILTIKVRIENGLNNNMNDIKLVMMGTIKYSKIVTAESSADCILSLYVSNNHNMHFNDAYANNNDVK
jgi:hypothetical protein